MASTLHQATERCLLHHEVQPQLPPSDAVDNRELAAIVVEPTQLDLTPVLASVAVAPALSTSEGAQDDVITSAGSITGPETSHFTHFSGTTQEWRCDACNLSFPRYVCLLASLLRCELLTGYAGGTR